MISIFRVEESSVRKVAHCSIEDVGEEMGHGVQDWELIASDREQKENHRGHWKLYKGQLFQDNRE
jgi:hypothetical protein